MNGFPTGAAPYRQQISKSHQMLHYHDIKRAWFERKSHQSRILFSRRCPACTFRPRLKCPSTVFMRKKMKENSHHSARTRTLIIKCSAAPLKNPFVMACVHYIHIILHTCVLAALFSIHLYALFDLGAQHQQPESPWPTFRLKLLCLILESFSNQ